MLKEAIWNDKVIFFAFSWYDLNVSEYFESSNQVAANIRNILHRMIFFLLAFCYRVSQWEYMLDVTARLKSLKKDISSLIFFQCLSVQDGTKYFHKNKAIREWNIFTNNKNQDSINLKVY